MKCSFVFITYRKLTPHPPKRKKIKKEFYLKAMGKGIQEISLFPPWLQAKNIYQMFDRKQLINKSINVTDKLRLPLSGYTSYFLLLPRPLFWNVIFNPSF